MNLPPGLARARRRPLAALFTLALVAQLAPLAATPVLPLHDAPGALGLIGVFAHQYDPAARIADFYEIDHGAYPSVLYFGWGWLAARLGVPIEPAFHAYLALLCLAGPPLALLLVLRAFGRPQALALLALPFVWHHQVWFGFLGSAAAVTGLLLALAFARRVIDHRRPADHLAFAGALLLTATAHPFVLAMTLAVVAPVLAAPGPPAARALRLACFAPTALFLAGWVARFFAGGGDGPPATARLLRELRLRRPPLAEDAATFLQWLGGGYAGVLDDLVAGLGLLALAVFLVIGVRGEPAPARGRWWLAWAAGVLALGYLLLPHNVYWPTYWWGVRVRCAVPLVLIAIAGVRASPRGLPRWALALPAVVALAWGSYVTADFARYFRGRVLDGFDEALAAIPPGQSVLGLPALPETHYTQGHPYLVQHYVVRKGGRASPYLLGHKGAYWVTMTPPPRSPPWGDPAKLSWAEHGLGWDYFLVEQPLGGPPPAIFPDAPEGAVELVLARGNWRVYRRVVR